ncbi:DUF262 domain-containing protein [Sulfurimonas paralvinellae]|nr:DUF262 domain-containing protein [Sulfurimonas paralvinellae]
MDYNETKNLDLKSIEKVIYENKKASKFFIPSYQRGYRWDDRQVLDLLDDIDEFAHKIKTQNEFYCLQPIVLRYDDENTHYKVIDGQQRLTTIYIILKYLQESSKRFNDIKKELNNNDEVKDIFEFCDIEDFEVQEPYSIEYETRTNSQDFLNNKLTEKINDSNPDYYHMSKAYQTTKEWFKTKNKKLFLDTLMKNTKFIWYEVDCKNDKEEIEIFSRLNIGKIGLTNAELIKAMLLLPIKDYKEQIEFSSVWDNIEQTLQKNDFWYFLSNDSKSETAIDLIFTALAQKYQKIYNKIIEEKYKNHEDEQKNQKLNFKITEDKYAYYIFAHILKTDFKSENKIWKESQELYRSFLNWYNDREIYHKVAYLIHFKHSLLSLYEKYEDKTKDEFKIELNELIEKGIPNINLMTLRYGEKGVHKMLLLFNIETILKNKNSNVRFDFFHFKFKDWDIEHIASQTDNINQEEWIKTVYKYIGNREINKDKINKIKKNFDKFTLLVKKMLNIKEPTDENKDSIGNLTLLDSKTNRSYGNAFFPVKRTIIIDQDSNGNFIPVCTKNVFLKQYSSKLSNMMNWTDDDVENYRNEILNLLQKYSVKCELEDVEND